MKRLKRFAKNGRVLNIVSVDRVVTATEYFEPGWQFPDDKMASMFHGQPEEQVYQAVKSMGYVPRPAAVTFPEDWED
jgi:hypothetical protein